VTAAEWEGVVGLRLCRDTGRLRETDENLGEGGKKTSAGCVVVSFERNDGVGERALGVTKEVVGERGVGPATDAF